MCGDGNMGKYIMITTAFYIFVDGYCFPGIVSFS